MWKLGLRILIGLLLVEILYGDPAPHPQLDLPSITSSTPATNPLITPSSITITPGPITPSPITIQDKNDNLVQPNSYAGENFSEEEQHPIGDFESDRSNRFGPPYDDEADYYNNRNPYVGLVLGFFVPTVKLESVTLFSLCAFLYSAAPKVQQR